MRVHPGSDSVDQPPGGVLTIGNFDGLHLGHEALVRAVVERARELGTVCGVYSFDPHPRRVLRPDVALPRLMTWDQLALGLEQRHVDFLVREPFTLEFSRQTAQEFLDQVIAARLRPREIFVGRDFHFGRGASGSGETLTRIGPTLGIRVTVIPQVRVIDEDVSSTRVRSLLEMGRVADAARCLGRPYAVWGKVVEGDQRGRTLGFPTANLDLENELLPANGVYASTVRTFAAGRPAERAWPSVTNVGTRPTFEPGRVLAEAHLLDFEGDLYGQRLELAFHERIREERRFSGPEELAAQIGRDRERARELLGARV
jgi:riboflavin kinase/FMN adenylyltransferase